MNPTIVIIDYDIGNVRSIYNSLLASGITAIVSRNKEVILNADGVILPGVGAFKQAMENLNKYNLVDVIHEYAQTKKPFLGICLGMQMLLDSSTEFGFTKGLGLISGEVVELTVARASTKLPHINWQQVLPAKLSWTNTIFHALEPSNEVYFVHTYIAQPKNLNNILALTQYEETEFCSALKENNIYGCQFHPEKSARTGLLIIKNFINICKETKYV